MSLTPLSPPSLVYPNEGCVVLVGAEPGAGAVPGGKCPVEEPFGVLDGEVDAAVAHGRAEVVVPVGAVEGVAVVKVLDPLHVGQAVVGAGGAVAAVHGLRGGAGPDAEEAGDGGIVVDAGGDDEAVYEAVAAPGVEGLVLEADFDPLFAAGAGAVDVHVQERETVVGDGVGGMGAVFKQAAVVGGAEPCFAFLADAGQVHGGG